ncbi:glycoside hydrolase superfamily [Clohesyomyces aquaticus]|uniref:Glycoside hydrolase superfamily n=1 Tax=Clohesyomyces aquaticus TaxID=1231657 RepID=A0A1Y1ZYP2_9PLEO|nr:glycoside hydrolase superfamily [Clohesyomyces aquaticus]
MLLDTLTILLASLLFLASPGPSGATPVKECRDNNTASTGRERLSLNLGWRFSRYTSSPDSLSYNTLKPSWEAVDLPHDWAIKGPFNAPGISGGMGRLPSNGIGWYRRKISFSAEDTTRNLFLDIEGAMLYAAVWLNGNLVGGWPYGYASWRLDLTPYAKSGDNILAIRVENAVENSRWYPGAGIYRDVWLVKANAVHVGQFGTYVTTPSISSSSATVNIVVDVENKGDSSQQAEVETKIYAYDAGSKKATGDAVATIASAKVTVASNTKQSMNGSSTIPNSKLWGPPPSQSPNQYVAITTISIGGSIVDSYETPFGIRTIKYDPTKGLIVNGEKMPVKGACNHHDLGSIGAAFHTRAAERQQQMLQEMGGGNVLRTSHNPPAPGFLDIADRLGMMVMDELFDAWAQEKRTNDYRLIWSDWHEADVRAFLRRDRQIGKELVSIAHKEDPTRQVTTAMNDAGAGGDLAGAVDIPGLNYQGEGWGSSWPSSLGAFQSKFPNKMLWSSESASTVSTRGTYFFPVGKDKTASVYDSGGADGSRHLVSAYELYGPAWASPPDKVFEQRERFPCNAGEFVWTGWDYIGEPTARPTGSNTVRLSQLVYSNNLRAQRGLRPVSINWPDRFINRTEEL